MIRKRRSTRGRAKASPALTPTLELEITGIGGRGDGLAVHGGEPVFVPFAAPGDRVLARVEGKRGNGLAAGLVEILQPAASRSAPPCPHFGTCGGCTLQHIDRATYAAWKREQLVDALGRAGFHDPSLVAPLVSIPTGTRRRAAFAFSRRRGSVSLGFNARASHQVVDLEQCPLLAPPILALLEPLRALLAEVLADGSDGDAIVTLAETGIDLLVEAPARLDLFDRERLAAFAERADLARLSWRLPGSDLAEPVAQRRPIVVRFGGIGVELPPAAFLQPSREGEQALSALVVEAVGSAGPVADLFAGCGSFSFPLALKAAVHAVEGEAAALQALKAAAERGGARVTTERRDLARQPLLPEELKRYQAVVFDPPRVGAAAQAEMLAKGGPPLVVAVSCNPATLARDARILANGGYRLSRATAVDQFTWSAHLEAVAVFQR